VPKIEHLYVHVPFCVAKCAYCAFYSRPGCAEQMSGYVDAVLAELRSLEGHVYPPLAAPKATRAPSWPPDENGRDSAAAGRPSNAIVLRPTTIFFGGGTPSILPAPLMSRLLEAVCRMRSPDAACEWTIEANPATMDREKAQIMRDAGVNRISLGVQSFDDALLKTIGRVHTAKQAVATYELLRKSGFENINLDLMFGLPGQTIAQFVATLQQGLALQPEHISAYCLILEKDTKFWQLYAGHPVRARHAVPLPDDDEQLAMYETAIKTLEAAGYNQYEVSNFAKPGRECAHNITYWKVEDYIGLGPSACSTVGDRRWQNVVDTDAYIGSLVGRAGPAPSGAGSARRVPVAYIEHLTPELRAAERAAFGMRMNAGVPADLVQGRWDKEIAGLLSAELAQWRNGRLQPTRRGILFADEVASEFV
jgi:oxygen-independent coproporphyrinogen III oxidase